MISSKNPTITIPTMTTCPALVLAKVVSVLAVVVVGAATGVDVGA